MKPINYWVFLCNTLFYRWGTFNFLKFGVSGLFGSARSDTEDALPFESYHFACLEKCRLQKLGWIEI